MTEQPALAQFLDNLLAQVAPPLAEALRLGAIPHRLNAELLSALLGVTKGSDAILVELQQLGVVTEIRANWFSYPDTIRLLLLAQQQEQGAAYQAVNARAAAYFSRQLIDEAGSAREHLQLEYLYHLLAADEAGGLTLLRRSFAHAKTTFQLGLAERLLDYATEQMPALSVSGKEWLLYLQAQLQQLQGDAATGKATFAELTTQATDPLLRAKSRSSLAETLIQDRQWLAAITNFTLALAHFRQLHEPTEVAQVQAGLGALYVNLAEAMGGLRGETPTTASHFLHLLYYVQHGPFLLYRWFSRRFSVVPNLYFGTNYQNWIIIRFLHSALYWFREAEQTLTAIVASDQANGKSDRIHIQIRLADLRHRIGRWSQAEKQFSHLLQADEVQRNRYSLALVQLGLARARLTREPEAMRPVLEECITLFQAYGDRSMAGVAAQLLGQLLAHRGEQKAAADTYLVASDLFATINQWLDATESFVAAQTIQAQMGAGPESDTSEAPLAARLQRHVYLARFPGRVHHTFQRLAIYLVLPLTYLLARTFTNGIEGIIRAIEILIVFVPDYAFHVAATADVFFTAPLVLIWPLGALWLYELLYALTGLVIVRFLPLSLLIREQATYFVTDEIMVGQYNAQGGYQNGLNWAEVQFVASQDRLLWRQPLALFSSFLISGEQTMLLVHGIINHYEYFKQEVYKRLAAQQHATRIDNFDFALLHRQRSILILAVTSLLTIITFFDWLDYNNPEWNVLVVRAFSGVRYTLYFTALAVHFMHWLLLIGPLFTLLHLVYHQQRSRSRLGKLGYFPFRWLLWLASLFFLLWTSGEVWALTQ